MADFLAPLSYGRLTGDFWAVVEDTVDAGTALDTTPLRGTVVFTPSYRVLRVTSEDVTKRGVVYVDTVTARVVDGVLVDDFGAPGVSLLATTSAEGEVFPHNIAWTATFNLAMASGEALATQPEPTPVRLAPGETKSISDFIPTVLEGGHNVTVVSVDSSTLSQVDSQVDYINTLVQALEIAVTDGVVKGDKGDKGDPGPVGPVGPVGAPGRAGLVETFNYVKNPVPTSNDGYEATDGTVAYTANTLRLVPDKATVKPYMTWIHAVPTFPGTNMYLQFDASTPSTVPLETTITFLNADLEPVDQDRLVHSADTGISVPDEVTSDGVGTYSHTAYTDGAASFAIFSVGFSAPVPTGTALTASKFYFSDSPGSYFNGSDTLSGYNLRWMGDPNNSYSVLTPISLLSSPTVTSVNGAQGDITIDVETLGLGLVDNTSDVDKPVSDPTQAALDEKLSTSDFLKTAASEDRNPVESMYFKEFSSYATQSVVRTSETLVDVSYIVAPIGGGSMVRLIIPGSVTGNSPSSIPTVELSNDGNTWRVWRTLTDAPPSSISYTSIDGEYDRSTGTLKVILRSLATAGNTALDLYTITNDGAVTRQTLGTFASASLPYNSPSIVSTPANDGTLYLYYMDSSNITRRTTITPDGVLGTATTNMAGLKTNAPAKVTRFYGTYVAATADSAVAGSPGLMLSVDGITWTHKGFTGTHTWDRDVTTRVMSAYPGVSSGKVGVFIDYISTTGYTVNRLFATARPTLTGTITGLTTAAGATSTAGSAISFPGTLPDVPKVFVSSNDSRLNLGVIAVTRDGGTIERFNMGAAPSPNATITWTAIS